MASPPFDVNIHVGRVIRTKSFLDARKPKLCKQWIGLDERTVQSAVYLLATTRRTSWWAG
jgi:hypothetical protein